MEFFDDQWQVIGAKPYIIPDKKRRSRKARHNFDVNASVDEIKEKIIALTALIEVQHGVIHCDLHIVSNRVNFTVVVGDDVEFRKSNARIG